MDNLGLKRTPGDPIMNVKRDEVGFFQGVVNLASDVAFETVNDVDC